MKMKTIIQSILAATVLSTSVHAVASGDEVLCPAASYIQQSWQTLNTVSVMSSNKFTVWNLDAVKNAGIYWYITTYATANDLNTALVAGQENVKNITEQKDQVAINAGEMLLCGYKSSSDPMGVTAVSFKSENEKIKIATFDIRALNLGKH